MDNSAYENADGGVLDYEVANGLQNIGNQYNENFMQEDSDMSFAEGEDDEFYNAGGFLSGFKERRADRHKARMEKKRAKTAIKDARAESKIAKGQAKLGLADAQKLSAEASSKGVEGDIAMAKALDTKPTQGMSKGMKTGLIVGGVVLVLGIVGFIMYKKSKKGK